MKLKMIFFPLDIIDQILLTQQVVLLIDNFTAIKDARDWYLNWKIKKKWNKKSFIISTMK